MARDVSEPAPTLGASKQTYRVSSGTAYKTTPMVCYVFSRNPEVSKTTSV